LVFWVGGVKNRTECLKLETWALGFGYSVEVVREDKLTEIKARGDCRAASNEMEKTGGKKKSGKRQKMWEDKGKDRGEVDC